MLKPSAKPATYEDLRALPDNLVGELIDGTLYAQPRPATPHTAVASGLGFDIGGPFDRGRGGPGGWIILGEPELHLGRHVVVPDLAGWRTDRLPREAMQSAFVTIAPDWVAEVASPSTTRHDRGRKMPLYAREGVGYLWLVDPIACVIESFERTGDLWLWLGFWGDETEAKIPPFDAVPLDLMKLWEPVRSDPRGTESP
jgi:Uma2 family endonuclease